MKHERLVLSGLIYILSIWPVVTKAQFTGGKTDVEITTVQEFRDQLKVGDSEGLLELAESVAKADDKTFILEGNVMAQIKDNLYEFKDKTGTLPVKINDFNGVKVGPENKVRLHGEADYDDGDLRLDVDKLELVE